MYAGKSVLRGHQQVRRYSSDCLGMGVMLATIWIHLGTDASTINDRPSVHFYSVAFLAFSMWFGRVGLRCTLRLRCVVNF